MGKDKIVYMRSHELVFLSTRSVPCCADRTKASVYVAHQRSLVLGCMLLQCAFEAIWPYNSMRGPEIKCIDEALEAEFAYIYAFTWIVPCVHFRS